VDNLIEKLRLHSEATRKSFHTLRRAKNLKELARDFFSVLMENLQVQKGIILFKNREKEDWQVLYDCQLSDPDLNPFLGEDKKFGISPLDSRSFKLYINYPLSDHSGFRILLGEKDKKTKYNEFDLLSLQFFLQQLENAYQFYIARSKEKELVFSLNHRVLQLNSLIDTSVEVSRLQESSRLLHLALERVVALTNASRGMLRIKSGNKILEKLYFPTAFKSKKLEKGKYQISSSFRFSDRIYQFYLFEKESREGIVLFDDTDELLLNAFTRQVHVSLENNYLHEQSLEKERIDQEISIAGTIQKTLIPRELPAIQGYDQFGINIPTKFIGGDYYDCIPLQDGRYVFIMADVSGKGVAASLLVSTLHASAHAYFSGPFELESVVKKLNEVIFDTTPIDRYITAVFSVLDPEKNELLTVNAGHNPTFVLRNDRKIDTLSTGGIPLGLMREALPYGSKKFTLNPGDSVFFYTDGVTEAMNDKEEQYEDFKPIDQFLVSSDAVNAEAFITDLITDIKNFTGDTPPTDDITALYLMKLDR
jgi:sigma-B regulation protein RsbU (phosphoserine phosphatase)